MRIHDEDNDIDMYEDIMEFHKTFCPDQILSRPSIPTKEVVDLRWRLIDEEVNDELLRALDKEDLGEIADAIFDSIVVLLGTAIAYGIPKSVWKEIHRSNMAKRQADGSVRRRADGKILKPKDWTPPDIASILKQRD